MTHWKSFMDNKWAGAWSFKGDTTVVIDRVEAATLQKGTKKDRKPVLYAVGSRLGIPLNSTNCKAIASMYGNNVEDWKGKRITLYPTTVDFGGSTVEAVRVRPRIPGASAVNGQISEDEPDEAQLEKLRLAREQAEAEEAMGARQ